jgi:predicted signal transduction protein with EAL and GGDEF domain
MGRVHLLVTGWKSASAAMRYFNIDTYVALNVVGLKVVGGSVETVGQPDWLHAAGSDYAQGYLFYEAIPPEELEQILKREQAKYLSVLCNLTFSP